MQVSLILQLFVHNAKYWINNKIWSGDQSFYNLSSGEHKH